MKYAITRTVLLATVAIMLASCNTLEKQLLSGNYETAFREAVDKLGKPNRKNRDDYILLVEDAFAFAKQEDLESIELLHAQGRADRWMQVMDLYSDIKYRQDLLRPHLPLYIKTEGRYADIELMEVIAPLAEAKQESAAFLYSEASSLMQHGTKLQVRDAYNMLEELERIAGSYKDSRMLKEEARLAGTDFVTVEIRNRTGGPVPNHVLQALEGAELAGLNDFWTQYLNCEPQGCPPDYRVRIKLESLHVSPEFRNELHYTESKTVFTANEADTSSTKGKQRSIIANVIETKQRKTATITGQIEYRSGNGRSLIKQVPVFAEIEFLNLSAKATGNMDALKDETLQKTKNGILPFPSDYQMLCDVQFQFENTMLAAMHDHRGVIGL